ncbi:MULTISPECIES: hypothetical protein [unclassified Streptomyces]|uniref:DUF7848 domain-containing protein n=1 Tax=unclassified Streptomyces TaxID=2593676 RepID=UPI00081F6CCC|nr:MULTISPECIES: hypothetical protein [unclassified Streptomyces]MYZ40722.1 hypothetical protein [Streptomyces sp. SID4917]SCG08443.1 hypothetical protein GA0115259_112962 [Streptomyces sp. MnatMP-M17]
MTATPSFDDYESLPRVPEKRAEYTASCDTTVEERLGLPIKCEQSSGTWWAPHPVDLWMADHSKRTGHTLYRRELAQYVDSGTAKTPDAVSPTTSASQAQAP